MKIKTDRGDMEFKPSVITSAEATEKLGNTNVVTDKKVYMDSPEDFLKMLDRMREIVVNDLPNWDVKQLFFIICDTGVQVLVEKGDSPPFEGVTQ